LLTGKIPYHELYNDAQVIFKRLSGEMLPEPDDAHPELWKLILDCWVSDPLTRPSIDQVLDRLENLQIASPESPIVPWSFELICTAVPMPIEDQPHSTSSPASSSLYEEPEVIEIDVMEKPPHDDIVEEFETTLDQMDEPGFLSNVPSLSSSINVDSFTYNQQDCSGMYIVFLSQVFYSTQLKTRGPQDGTIQAPCLLQARTMLSLSALEKVLCGYGR
jgi:hypothetical protein